MNLQDRIRNQERRTDDLTPIVDRRVEQRIPEWRRRALEQQQRLGNVAVTDLTGRAA